MAELWFYRLEARPASEVLPQLLEKSLERGWRVVVELGNAEAIAKVSQSLWAAQPESFLAHAHEGDGTDQPIWLTAGDDNPNSAQVRIFIEGAVPKDINGLERAIYLFEDGDQPAVEAARERWKLAREQGTTARYFIHKDGRWNEQKA